jgi:hypothetical protein
MARFTSGLVTNLKDRKEKCMNQDKRVLARMQARDLTEKEIHVVTGGSVHTETVCTVPNASFAADGDPGECGGI